MKEFWRKLIGIKIEIKENGWKELSNVVTFTPQPFNYQVIIVALYFLLSLIFTSWTIVGKDENATVRIFGKYTDTLGSGFHFVLPSPISQVKKTKVTEMKRMEIGFRTIDNGPPAKYEDVPEEAQMLTGDLNVVNLDFIVQYITYDAAKWQFRVKEPEKLLNYLAQSSMRLVVGRTSFDEIATTGKAKIQVEVEQNLQKQCDMLDFGVRIILCQIQDALPPGPVGAAFKEVVNAKEEKDKLIYQAKEYRNGIIPKTKGEAQQRINNALGYEEKQVKSAEGEVSKWSQLLTEYRKNPDLIKAKMIFETQQAVIPGSRVIFERPDGLGVLKHFTIPTEEKAMNRNELEK